MKEFTAETQVIETASALNVISQHQKITHYPAYIGLDVHKDTIVIAVAEAGREAPHSRGAPQPLAEQLARDEQCIACIELDREPSRHRPRMGDAPTFASLSRAVATGRATPRRRPPAWPRPV